LVGERTRGAGDVFGDHDGLRGERSRSPPNGGQIIMDLPSPESRWFLEQQWTIAMAAQIRLRA
jgi:hypothetical protein